MSQAEGLKVAPDEAPVPCIHSYKAVNCGGGGGGGGGDPTLTLLLVGVNQAQP